MSDNEAQVKITASIAELKSAMQEGAHSVKEFSEKTKEHIEGITGVFEKLNGIMLGFAAILAGGKAFKEAIESTERLTEETRKLSSAFGVTTEMASGISQALDASGIAADDYIGAAQKLDRQLKTNAEALAALGFQAYTSSGALKNQQDLMAESVRVLGEYKEGTDRNLAAQVLFGRGVSDVGKLLRLTREEMEEGAQDAKDLGLVVGEEDVEAWHKFHKATHDANDVIDGMWKVLADQLRPVLTDLADWFRSVGPAAINGFRIAILSIKAVIIELWGALQTLILGMEEGASLVAESLITMSEVASHALVFDFSGAQEAFKRGTKNLEAILQESGRRMTQIAKDMAAPFNKDYWTPPAHEKKEAHTGKSFPKALLKNENTKKEEEEKGKEEDKLRELSVAREKLLAQESIKTAQDRNKELLDLNQITNAEYLQRKLELQEQLDAIELRAAEDKQQAIQNDRVAYEKAGNDIIAIKQKQAQTEKAIQHEITLDAQKDYLKLSQDINSSFSNAVSSVIDGSKSMKQAFSDFTKGVLDNIAKMAAKNITEGLFGGPTGASGTGGGLGGLITGLLGSGGGSAGGLAGMFAGFLAGGGPASAGKGYVVGENGPEFFMPDSNGTVYNQAQMAQMGGTVIHMTVNTQNAQSFRQNSGQVMADAQSALRRSMRNA